MNAPFDIDRECERMRANASHRATHEPSPVARSRPYGWVSTFAVVLVVLTVLYFGAQFVRAAL